MRKHTAVVTIMSMAISMNTNMNMDTLVVTIMSIAIHMRMVAAATDK